MIVDSRNTAIVAYVSIVGWIIAFAAGEKNDEFAKYHLNQGLVLSLAEIIVSGVLGVLSGFPFIGWIFKMSMAILGVLYIILVIYGAINAANNENKPLPIIGEITILR